MPLIQMACMFCQKLHVCSIRVFVNNYVFSIWVWLYKFKLIKTHGSESRGQEEACRPTRRTSELFTGSTAVKLVNALNKPPLKLSLSYQGLSTS